MCIVFLTSGPYLSPILTLVAQFKNDQLIVYDFRFTCQRMAHRVAEEFRRQSSLEHSLGLPPTPHMLNLDETGQVGREEKNEILRMYGKLLPLHYL